MSFTDSTTVRKHLQETASLRDSFRDVTVELLGLSPMALLHSQLREGTVVVKGKELGAPRTALVTLDSTPVSLGLDQRHSRQRGGGLRHFVGPCVRRGQRLSR